MGKKAWIFTLVLVSVILKARSLSATRDDHHALRTLQGETTSVNDDELVRATEYDNQRSDGHESRRISYRKQYPSDTGFAEKHVDQSDETERNSIMLKNRLSEGFQQTQSVVNPLQIDDKGARQFPCPDNSTILPCECTYDDFANLYMNCTNVESSEQLASVFQAEFPFRAFKSFYMGPNPNIKIFGDIFNGVTFEEVEIVRATNLELVSQYWLYDSRATLKYLTITHTKLRSETFPFISMDAYTKLETLYITYSNLTLLPPLHSNSLTEVAFEASNIELVTPETFQNATGLTYINLGDNNITALSADTFRLVSAPSTIYLYQNSITSIEVGTFVLPSDPEGLSLRLHVGVNKLTTLDEAVFGAVFPYVTEFDVFGNPLECGCDVAWLITDEDNMAKVDDWAQCSDGTNLHDLDPKPYEEIC